MTSRQGNAKARDAIFSDFYWELTMGLMEERKVALSQRNGVTISAASLQVVYL